MLIRLLLFAAVFFHAVDLFSGGWTLPRGRVWMKSMLYYQSSRSRFCTVQDAASPAFQSVGCSHAGDRAPFDPFSGGQSQALAIFTELAYGVTGWLDLGLQVPFYSLQFTNLADPNRPGSQNLGDIRFYSKIRLLQGPVVTSVKLGAKSPTGKFNIDAEAVNVSEGQWDFEAFLEMSRSLWPVRGYSSLGIGYRIRTDNPDFEHSFGNEFFARVEAGYNVTQRFFIKGSLDYLRSALPRVKSTGAELFERRELLVAGALPCSISSAACAAKPRSAPAPPTG